jgi:hypothetical protein
MDPPKIFFMQNPESEVFLKCEELGLESQAEDWRFYQIFKKKNPSTVSEGSFKFRKNKSQDQEFS